jgi:hypothetical protein
MTSRIGVLATAARILAELGRRRPPGWRGMEHYALRFGQAAESRSAEGIFSPRGGGS